MATFGAIELTTVTRAQDYTTIKQNEDNRGMIAQTHLGQQQQKDEKLRASQVREGDNTQWQNRKFDARDKGSNEYQGDGGKRRRDNTSNERNAFGGQQSFDIKI